MSEQESKQFTFNISLSVLNHLGRNLYRSFITVLGEAISNAWDADADNVWIDINRAEHSFIIKDDGFGMSNDDFQGKFLKIGYSKRKSGITRSPKGRPFIGRKGIGKLALLSCADTITVLSKEYGGEFVGGVINNSDLDQAITDDLASHEYQLGVPDTGLFGSEVREVDKGTLIHFDGIHGGIINTVEYLRSIVALYFRFALIDKDFSIYLNGDKITLEDLKPLADKTQFLWHVNEIDDPFVSDYLKEVKEEGNIPVEGVAIKGFIASVKKPSDLKIRTSDEKASIDLFVNGRLRERDVLRHIPSARIVENYLYGQIHLNELDGEKDSFTSSREGIVEDDPIFKRLLNILKTKVMPTVIEQWDQWRLKHNQEGDSDNPRVSKRERKSRDLYSAVSEDYSLEKGNPNKRKVDSWVKDLSDDAQYNFSSYAECFISENLIRKYIEDQSVSLSQEANTLADEWRRREDQSKNIGNISIDIRRIDSDLSYLAMNDLANLVDKKPQTTACLAQDAKQYKPMRDAVAHTSLLSAPAKAKLTSVYENVKARLVRLLSDIS